MPTPTDLRKGVAGIAVLADRRLAAVWTQTQTAPEARDALLDVLPGLVTGFGLAAAAFAADWYDEARAMAGARGRFSAIPADIGDAGADALARWGVSPLFRAEPDWSAARVLVAGGLQRRIANAARQTITVSSVQDPAALGWQRAGSGGCDFCRDLIAAGTVYRDESADFDAHDHCNCAAVPAFT